MQTPLNWSGLLSLFWNYILLLFILQFAIQPFYDFKQRNGLNIMKKILPLLMNSDNFL